MRLQYLLVAGMMLAFGACNRPSPEELFSKARQDLEAKNFAAAIENYTRVIRDYPESTVAETSMFSLGAIRQNGTHEYREAISAYRQYLERYPKGPRAPEAMFLIGYIFNNEMSMLDSAAQAYQSFLAAYPNHVMAQSARFELDNLGKSPEEILPKNLVAEEPAKKHQHSSAPSPRGKR